VITLSRRKDEEILVGDSIRIVVKKIKGSRVVLGIEAPKKVLILRKELKEESDD